VSRLVLLPLQTLFNILHALSSCFSSTRTTGHRVSVVPVSIGAWRCSPVPWARLLSLVNIVRGFKNDTPVISWPRPAKGFSSMPPMFFLRTTRWTIWLIVALWVALRGSSSKCLVAGSHLVRSGRHINAETRSDVAHSFDLYSICECSLDR
jgi:hypothetical protein